MYVIHNVPFREEGLQPTTEIFKCLARSAKESPASARIEARPAQSPRAPREALAVACAQGMRTVVEASPWQQRRGSDHAHAAQFAPAGPHVSITTADGDRVFMEIKPDACPRNIEDVCH
jgi:hypothetical protein